MKKDSIYVEHIIDAADLIKKYTHGISQKQFEVDTLIRDGVVRQIEIIGEASRAISDEFKEKHKDIPWHQIIGMRNRLIHEYVDVDEEEVYRTAKNDIPQLREDLKSIVV